MIIQETEMKISRTYRADSAPEEPKSALRGLMQRVGLTVLACTLVIGATGSATAGEARDEAAVRALEDTLAKAFVQKDAELRAPLFAEYGTFVTQVADFLQMRVAMVKDLGPEAQQAVNGTTQVAPPISGVIGKVQSFTGGSLDVQTPSGVVHVDVKQPLTTYKQIPSDLSHVTSASYVGVASTEQADGKEVAKQIIIFPAELSGAAEGSVLTDPPGATTHSRMTNGSVSRPAESHSRMTNGTVQKGSGTTTLVVQYQDGSKTISVPANVPVTRVAPEQVTFANGDIVYAATEKLPNGTLVTDKIFLFIPAASPNTKQ
jgi:uncharacterized protein (TIGR02246 family)